MENKGWIKTYRQLQDCWVWQEKPYSKGQAWIDLLLLANHRDKKILFNGNIITVQRGQYLTSMVKLAEKWGWGRPTVLKFLNLLEKDKMITRNSDNSKTLITIENYGIYQDFEENALQGSLQAYEQPTLQQDCTPNNNLINNCINNPLYTNNNDNNDNNDKECIKNEREYSAPPFDAERAWKDTLDKYPKKSAAVMAKQRWMEMLVDTPEPNRKDVAVLIFNAIKLYLLDYEKNNPDDKTFRYIPKLHDWLVQDCGYWITKAEEWQREASENA